MTSNKPSVAHSPNPAPSKAARIAYLAAMVEAARRRCVAPSADGSRRLALDEYAAAAKRLEEAGR